MDPQQLSGIAEVTECPAITSSDDILLQVVARDTEHLHEIAQRLLALPTIARTSTSIVLKEYRPYRTNQLLGK